MLCLCAWIAWDNGVFVAIRMSGVQGLKKGSRTTAGKGNAYTHVLESHVCQFVMKKSGSVRGVNGLRHVKFSAVCENQILNTQITCKPNSPGLNTTLEQCKLRFL